MFFWRWSSLSALHSRSRFKAAAITITSCCHIVGCLHAPRQFSHSWVKSDCYIAPSGNAPVCYCEDTYFRKVYSHLSKYIPSTVCLCWLTWSISIHVLRGFMEMISHSQTHCNVGNKDEGTLQDQKQFDFQWGLKRFRYSLFWILLTAVRQHKGTFVHITPKTHQAVAK